MIDPKNVTDHNRTDEDLWEFWLFCLFVRGKNADVQAGKLEQFLNEMLRRIWCFSSIYGALQAVRSGQYQTLARAIWQTHQNLSENPRYLRDATVKDLEEIPGVGPKTSRFFVLHTRANARVAVLDTHILKFLWEREGLPVPKNTPQSAKQYQALEEAFLLIADYEDVNPAHLDLAVWRASREEHSLAWRSYMPIAA